MTTASEIKSNQNEMEVAVRRISAILRESYGATNVAKTLTRVGVILTNEIKRLLSTPGSGETYGSHTASAPGEPPAVDTGRLRSSINWQLGESATSAYVDVGTNVEYGPFLEYGTRNMAARPFMRPAMQNVMVIIEQAIVDSTARQVTAVARAHGAR